MDDKKLMDILTSGAENEPEESKEYRESLLAGYSNDESENDKSDGDSQDTDDIPDDLTDDKTGNEDGKDDSNDDKQIERDNGEEENEEPDADQEDITALNFIKNIGTREKPKIDKLDFTKVDELSAEQIEADRENYAKQISEEAKRAEEQKLFFSSISKDVELLPYDKTLSVIVPDIDGKPNETYNAQLHGLVDSLYAGVAGIRQYNYTDDSGQVMVGTEATRTDIQYKDFAKSVVGTIDSIVKKRVAKEVEDRVEAIKRQGNLTIKPTNKTSQPTKTSFTVEDIASMSPDEYEKNKDKIYKYMASII